MRWPTDREIESVCSATGVLCFGIAIGLTAMGLHNGAPVCQTVAGQAITDHCQMLAWGQRQATRAIRVSLLSFGAATAAHRGETVRKWVADLWGESS